MKKIYALLVMMSMINAKQMLLVTGGAGYIGSHTAWQLAQKEYNVVVLDKKITNEMRAHGWATWVEGDVADAQLLHELFAKYQFDAVLHFAGYIEVGLSVKDPLSFYQNNTANTIALLQVMHEHGVSKFIFSSTAAVYGEPQQVPIAEDHPKDPVNPYGRSKWMVEQILQDCTHAYGMQYVALRYFNAAGGSVDLGLGERHEPETHLLPLLLQAAVLRQASDFAKASTDRQDVRYKPFNVFGDDWPTPDNTCIRDYLHVKDLASAHWLALEYLNNGGSSIACNLGTGCGTSIKEMITQMKHSCDLDVDINWAPRREGDPAVLVADPSLAYTTFGWQAQHSSTDEILRSAYEFMVG